MRQPDETDLEILRLLIEDGRRPYSEIAEHVGLTPPAVSDRVARLQELDIIQTFTLDVDRTKLQDRVPALLHLEVKPEAVERVFEHVSTLSETEHTFQQLDGSIVAHVNAPNQDVHSWFRAVLEVSDLVSYDIKPLAHYEWNTGIDPADFSLSCAVCDNAVTSDGETAQVGDEIKVFCCSSCQDLYEQRYESLQQGID
ncbi:Lrp/AsnC family transcriptional regulator [Natronolimnobius baerhuensis]|uniref:Transcriptional regulator n=1 Tax=Natronolimnobius baerhuensis TaxID=253108 RepID=A0A202E715_9EURY|nr:AsnC family transcriptional regulator [Natronolimnobius baerhuensis]OVE84039.1 transcriptional regulator [Natronolimnobius baerhuensis]